MTPGVAAQAPAPVLISESNSTRALALESIAFTREPFPLDSLLSWSPDRRTRVVLFALNLQLLPGEDPASISADAEDASHRHYILKVENAGPVPGNEWMSALTIRLSDDLSDVGDVLVGIVNKGRTSNRVRIAIGHPGGGPTDDPGAKPTSPYLIRGIVLADGLALPGAALILEGNGSAVSTMTNNRGEYLIATVGGDYVLSAAKTFYDFSPPSRTLTNLSSALDDISFSASRQQRNVSGVALDESGAPIPNLEISLTGGTPERKITTGANGQFTFADVPAGFAYRVTPTDNNIFTFNSQTIDLLRESTTLVFGAVRRHYTISGRVLDGASGIANATVSLVEANANFITDAQGNYSFSELPAGSSFTVKVTKEDYAFETPQVVSAIESNRKVDIKGNPYVFLTGRVLDQDGRGVFGVKVEVTGTQNGLTATSADGSYSFLVTAFGNYVLRPWKEQDYYDYTPVTANLTALKGSRVADFNSAWSPSVSPSYVLEFDGTQKTVDYSIPITAPFDYNLFWPDGLDFGHFFWEFWAMPGENAGGTYMISDGYGGAHAILFGVANINSREPNRYQLLGNVWNGSYVTYFASDEGPAPHEWGHYAVGWDGQNIVTYFNGVPVGLAAWTGPRITPGGIQGCGRLLIGGSDHANFIGRIAQVRGYERDNPRENSNSVFASFAPQTVFSREGNLLSYFFRPSENIADLSPIGQYGKQHPGLLKGTSNGVTWPCNGCPVPQFVVDPTAPDFAHPNNPGPPPGQVEAPLQAPDDALLFDSFSRRNSTYVLSGLGGLGATESGSLGSQSWHSNQPAGQPQPFGILNGRAVLLADATAVAWINVPTSVADFGIRVERHAGLFGTGHNTGLSFRVADANNYFFAYSRDNPDPSQPQTATIGYYSAGVRTELASGILLPATWRELQVFTTHTGAISFYVDDIILYSTNTPLLAGSLGAGLYNNGPGLALTNRWDDFAVFRLP